MFSGTHVSDFTSWKPKQDEVGGYGCNCIVYLYENREMKPFEIVLRMDKEG
jgi:hypothetical protein